MTCVFIPPGKMLKPYVYIIQNNRQTVLGTTCLRVYNAVPALMWRPEKHTTFVLPTALKNPFGRYFCGLYINKYKMLKNEKQLLAVSRDIVCVAKIWRPKMCYVGSTFCVNSAFILTDVLTQFFRINFPHTHRFDCVACFRLEVTKVWSRGVRPMKDATYRYQNDVIQHDVFCSILGQGPVRFWKRITCIASGIVTYYDIIGL